MAGIELHDVMKRFGDEVIVKELNLHIQEGEFLVIVGPSGCGKSTTLRMIAGLETVSHGSIIIADQDVTRLPPKKRDLAMVFQSYALYPHMDVAGNMSFALRLAKFPKAEVKQRVQRAAAMLGIENLLARKPKDLSGGQRQRVAMGRAIVRDAYGFLFDEPLSNLDAKLRAQMRTELALLHKRLGKTMLYVTHDQIEAMTMADRIVIMAHGDIQQIGTPKEVYNSPCNRFVAGFIGSPSMNFLDCEVHLEGDVVRVKGSGFDWLVPERLKQRFAKAVGKPALLGLRPEHFRGPAVHGQAATLAAVDLSVEVTEYIGSNQLLAAHIGDTPITASIATDEDDEPAASGAYLFDTNRMYLFDQTTELAY